MYKAIYGLPGLYLGALIGFSLTLFMPIDFRGVVGVIVGVPIGALSIGIPLINVGARKDRAQPRRWGYESAFRVGVCVFLGLYLGEYLGPVMLGGFLGACGGLVWSFVAFRLKRPLHWIYEAVFRVGVGGGIGLLVSPVLDFFLVFIMGARFFGLYDFFILGCGLGAVFGALWSYISAQIKRIKRQDTGTTVV